LAIEHQQAPVSCCILHVTHATSSRDHAHEKAQLAEAENLCEAIALDVQQMHIIRLRAITPATYIGRGKAEEIAEIIAEKKLKLVMINTTISPLQQRNLEAALGCKVIDRTALILEIFGARANTAEGKLQVELAALTYQKSRLVKSWTHLERQRGGFGFMGGPGESQIEIDRRLVGERIDKIKKQLTKTVRTRDLHRKQRKAVPYPIIALVGYTNAGKSCLFNRLTGANVVAKDMLFATLDPTLRALILPSGTQIIMADTVGFIANLPTELIAAFRATLEEVLEADILIHVRDASNPDNEAQKEDVMQVLASLYNAKTLEVPMIEVMNKIDLLPEDAPIFDAENATSTSICLSAKTGDGCENLLHAIDDALRALQQSQYYALSFPASAGKAYAWLNAHAKPDDLTLDEATYTAKAHLSQDQLRDFIALDPKIKAMPL
jgi:GTP-binding protein HflX